MDDVADHLVFLVLTENLARATKLFERHFLWLEQSRDLYHHFCCLLAGWLLFDALSAEADEKVQLKLGRFFPHYSENNLYHAKDLALWCKQEAVAVAKRFDERNETNHFKERVEQTLKLKKLCAPFPL